MTDLNFAAFGTAAMLLGC